MKDSNLTNSETESMEIENRISALREHLKQYTAGPVVLAFSGGVDSSLLCALLCRVSHQPVHAVLMQTKLHPVGEAEDAKKIAEALGARFHKLEIDELERFDILNNPVDRCYRCKKGLFSTVLDFAQSVGANCVLEGTNADDLLVYRPGILAIRELGIISPLADLGFTKEEVRAALRSLGMEVAKKPSTPCLATRLPYGARVDYELLSRIEKGESFLCELGFYNVRLRVHDSDLYDEYIGSIARLEVDKESFGALLEKQQEIIACLKDLGFTYVTLDLEGFRSGSMDVVL